MHDRGGNGNTRGVHIALVSVHGLIRAENLELGRDPDTGGQTLYVVQLASALGRRPEVSQVDLLTRRVVDDSVDPIYAQRIEAISEKARIVRIDCGPEEYIRKEELWDHLDAFADNTRSFYQAEGRPPEIVHSHYADAGYVGSRLAAQFSVPLVHTGHSLGRVKRRRLLASGLSGEQVEQRYHISRRIDAEEDTLAAADRIIVSTANEIDKQYGLYDRYQPELMRIIPPGTDMSRFRPPDGSESDAPIYEELRRFLRRPDKPMVLAICRPDERKNIATLVDAYGGSPELQQAANLVVVAGSRDEIFEMDDSAARVISDLLHRIDSHDLYGRVAYPKRHLPDEVPELYRLAAAHRGVFVNPALTEPFGLTLIEAAASGVPIVATEDGGPGDIVANCNNGYLVNPLDAEQIAATLLKVIEDGDTWDRMVEDGLRGVREHYTWEAHADRYLSELQTMLAQTPPRPKPDLQRRPMLYHDRALFSDLDQNLLGDTESLEAFVEVLRRNRKRATFGIATGRRLDSALNVMRRLEIPRPDVLITSVGTEIHYGPEMTPDLAWRRHIDHLWTPRTLRTLLDDLPGLKLQPTRERNFFKLSYYYDPNKAPTTEEISRILHQNDQTVNMFISFGQYLDIVPGRASKGFALRWFCEHWGIPLNRVLAAGGSGTDEDMIRGNTLAAVVGNRHDEELSDLVQADRIYFAKGSHASGILEAIEHYDFFETCRVPAKA
ncbi:MAG: HAD-IIB family hydrolase [bacterium]|nr:HAD-IIB family hydrolase [bacterium]